MAIRDNSFSWAPENLRRKCNQAWDMAGLARQDGDKKDEARWTAEAQRLQELMMEMKP